MKQRYKVQARHEKIGWHDIPFASGTLAYCHGRVDCLDSQYPAPPCRILSPEGVVVRETSGRARLEVNKNKP
jgi:hypothetical protein